MGLRIIQLTENNKCKSLVLFCIAERKYANDMVNKRLKCCRPEIDCTFCSHLMPLNLLHFTLTNHVNNRGSYKGFNS